MRYTDLAHTTVAAIVAVDECRVPFMAKPSPEIRRISDPTYRSPSERLMAAISRLFSARPAEVPPRVNRQTGRLRAATGNL